MGRHWRTVPINGSINRSNVPVAAIILLTSGRYG
jgi:hypothetical protein